MRTIRVFVDTCIVNRLLDIDKPEPDDPNYEEDRSYLTKIVENGIDRGAIQPFVNPTVRTEIEGTPDPSRRQQLLEQFRRLHFTPFTTTVFPIHFTATFLTPEEKRVLEDILPSLGRKDLKILADAMSSDKIEVLLTTDRDHLANEKLRGRLRDKGVDKKMAILIPKELYEYLQRLE